MTRNQISLADQLRVIKYLRKNPAVVGEGCKDIAKRAGEALEMQLTPINISTCMKAIGMTTSKAEARTKKNRCIQKGFGDTGTSNLQSLPGNKWKAIRGIYCLGKEAINP